MYLSGKYWDLVERPWFEMLTVEYLNRSGLVVVKT